MKFFFVLVFIVNILGRDNSLLAQGFVVNHSSTDITKIPEESINRAKSMLHIGYGHTSHGSQLTYGMTDLVDFANNGGNAHRVSGTGAAHAR